MSDRGPTEPSPAAAAPEGRPATLFDRAFPGPAPRDPRVAARLEALQQMAQERGRSAQQRARQRARDGGPLAGAEELDRLVEAVHEQTDVLRALLDAEVTVRDDAKATAQNSRTFAIAGTVIAFLTLIGTVVLVVTAFTNG